MGGRLCFLALCIASGCIRSPADIPPLSEGGFVTGIVVEQSLTTGDVVGLEGAIVRDLGTGKRVATDDRGFFSLERLPIGRRVVVNVTRGLAPALGDDALRLRPLVLRVDGQTIDLGEVRLGENGALEGRVLLSSEDAVPSGAGGSLVVVAQTPYKGVTSVDGRFSIPSVPQGTFEVIAFAAGYRPARASGVPVNAASTTKVRDLVLEPGMADPVAVSGQAYLAGSEDHSGIDVSLADELDPSVTIGPSTTDASGSYTLPTVPAGVYRARFERAGYGSVELPGVAVLPEGTIGLLEVTLQEGAGGGNVAPGDRDGDGCPDADDAFPDDPFGCYDTDGDGIPDSIDTDDDGDTLPDYEELSDGLDGFVTDPLNPNSDGDAFDDANDVCPTLFDLDQDPAACREQTGRLPPIVTGFSPESGAVGSTVTIDGRSFFPGDRFNSVQFGDGAVAVPSLVTESRILVAVPSGARSGPISVLTGGQVATSSRSFTFIEPPRIVRVVPPSARASAEFAVVGENLAGGEIFIGGVNAVDRPCAQDEVTLGDGEEALCAVVPSGAATGRLEVRTPDRGTSQEDVTFVVLQGPLIYEIRPNVAPAGATVSITGEGFDTTDTGGQVMVEFAGAAPVAPDRVVADRLIEVTVPAGAASGVVHVRHPAGDAASPVPFVLDDDAPVVLGADHTLIEAGDTLTLLGANLQDATAVTFSGGAAGTGVAASPGQVTVTVPAGIDPGPVTVTHPGGMTVSAFELAVLERTPGPALTGYFTPGLVISGDDSILYAVASNTRELVIIDAATMDEASRLDLGVPEAARYLVGPPSGSTAVLLTNDQIRLFTLPAGVPIGSCLRTPQASSFADTYLPPFDDQERYVFLRKPNDAPPTEEGFLRVDLGTGACDYFMTAPTFLGLGPAGMIFDPTTRSLILSHGSRGLARVDVLPGGAADGTFVTPWTMPGVRGRQLLRGLAGPRLYATGPLGIGVEIIDPFTGRPVQAISTTTGKAIQTKNGRWLFVASQVGNGYFVDLLTERVAKSITGVDVTNGAAGVSELYLDIDLAAGLRLSRFTIRD